MRTNFFLAAGLLVSAIGMGQTTIHYPTDVTNLNVAGSTGQKNVHIGYKAGLNSTDKESNTFVGYLAGESNSGSLNCFFGYSAGQYAIQGGNVFVGHNSGQNATGGSNTFVGRGSGVFAADGSNVAIGYFAGRGTTTIKLGQKNVLLGVNAGNYLIGDGNVFIGANAGASGDTNPITTSNKLYIANTNTINPLIYGEFDTRFLKFNANKVGIGYDATNGFGPFPTPADVTNIADYKLFVNGNILAKEIRVRTNWADYVFAADYSLMPLKEVEKFISANGHLPNVPAGAVIEKEGVELGNIVKVQQEKIEELTLYLIEQNKQIEALKVQMEQLLNKK